MDPARAEVRGRHRGLVYLYGLAVVASDRGALIAKLFGDEAKSDAGQACVALDENVFSYQPSAVGFVDLGEDWNILWRLGHWATSKYRIPIAYWRNIDFRMRIFL